MEPTTGTGDARARAPLFVIGRYFPFLKPGMALHGRLPSPFASLAGSFGGWRVLSKWELT